jgi:hypothetical protein
MLYRWPARELLKEENPKYWSEYLEILDDGIYATLAGRQGCGMQLKTQSKF